MGNQHARNLSVLDSKNRYPQPSVSLASQTAAVRKTKHSSLLNQAGPQKNGGKNVQSFTQLGTWLGVFSYSVVSSAVPEYEEKDPRIFDVSDSGSEPKTETESVVISPLDLSLVDVLEHFESRAKPKNETIFGGNVTKGYNRNSFQTPILDYNMDLQDAKKIEQDIDEMFSYLDGWLDDSDDSKSEETDMLSVSAPEVEIDGQSDDSAVGVDYHRHRRYHSDPFSTSEDTDPERAESSEDSATGDDLEPKKIEPVEVTSEVALTRTMFEPVIVADARPAAKNAEPARLSRPFSLSEIDYAQLEFPLSDVSVCSGPVREKNNAAKSSTGSQWTGSDHTSGRTTTEADELQILYSRITRDRPKSSDVKLSTKSGSSFSGKNENVKVELSTAPDRRSRSESPMAAIYSVPFDDVRSPHFQQKTHPQTMSEGSIVHSLYSLSSPMPGTISFISGETGVLMRTNVGGWCYICMRDKEGWAPANYWQPLRSALRERVRSRNTAERNALLDDWYLGPISRPDSEFLLLQFGHDGQFLVRNSTVRAGEFTLTMRHKNQVHHFAIRKLPDTGKFTIGSVAFQFNSLSSIIAHYRQHTILSDTYAVLKEAFSVQL